MKEVRLYEVKTPRGDVIFSLFDPEAKWVWTERSELAARQIASEKGYRIVAEAQITHAEMLRLIGQDAPPPSRPAPAPPPATQTSEAHSAPLPAPVMVIPALNPTPPTTLGGPAPKFVYHFEDELSAAPSEFKADLPDVAEVATPRAVGHVFQSNESLSRSISASEVEDSDPHGKKATR